MLFISIAWKLADPNIGLSNTNASPHRLLGWVSYCAIESFGSICISLFWSFVNSIIHFDGAKSAYGLIVAGAQVLFACMNKYSLFATTVFEACPLHLKIDASSLINVISSLFLFDGSKVGAILGPTLALKCSYTLGVPLLYGLGGGLMGLMVSAYVRAPPPNPTDLPPLFHIACRIVYMRV